LILTIEELKSEIKNKDTIICSGWFDLFHIGHLNFLKNAKKLADYLIVVVRNDTDGKYIKGENRPIINQQNRLEIIDSLKCVDYTILSDNFTNQNKLTRKLDKKSLSSWDKYISIIEEIKPNKVFSLWETLGHNGFGKYIETLGIKVIYTDRFKGISTTDIERKLKIAK